MPASPQFRPAPMPDNGFLKRLGQMLLPQNPAEAAMDLAGPMGAPVVGAVRSGKFLAKEGISQILEKMEKVTSKSQLEKIARKDGWGNARILKTPLGTYAMPAQDGTHDEMIRALREMGVKVSSREIDKGNYVSQTSILQKIYR